MRNSENARHLPALLSAIKPTEMPRLICYSASNLLYRATKRQLFKEAVFNFQFGKFKVLPNRGDIGTIGEIFVQRPYQIFPDFIPKDGDTCIDIGANIGCVSLQWRLTNRTGMILAVEPHPITFGRMLENFALNDIRAIDSVQAAIGSQDAEVEIVIDKDNNSMARVVGDHLQFIKPFDDQTTARVACMMVDTLVDERHIDRVNLLKIDVEGFEVECLKGATNTLQITDKIVLEYHSDELKRSCTTILESSGFKCEVGGSLIFARKQN